MLSVAGFSPPASDNEDFSSGQGIVETFCAEGQRKDLSLSPLVVS